MRYRSLRIDDAVFRWLVEIGEHDACQSLECIGVVAVAEVSNHQLGLREAEHRLQALWRPGGINRQISPTSFYDGKKGNNQFNGSFQADSDDDFRADTEINEVMSELVGAGVKFLVGKLLILKDQGDGIRRAFNLLFKELMHAEIGHIDGGPILPGFDQLAFGIRQQAEGIGICIRFLKRRSQQSEQMGAHALNALSTKQFSGIDHLSPQAALLSSPQIELQIKLGG